MNGKNKYSGKNFRTTQDTRDTKIFINRHNIIGIVRPKPPAMPLIYEGAYSAWV